MEWIWNVWKCDSSFFLIFSFLFLLSDLVDALGRTQITALPSRTMAQTSITVTRPLTSNTIMPRGKNLLSILSFCLPFRL